MHRIAIHFHVSRSAWALLLAASFWSVAAHGADTLQPYTACRFDNGLQVEHIDGLGPAITSRPIKTRRDTKVLQMVAGTHIMIGFAEENFFANVKAEALPAETYPQQRQLILDGFDYILGGDNGVTRNYALPSSINGFEMHGLDRTKLEGGVLGIYLLLDDTNHIATTMYLLNQEPERRTFSDMAGYAKLRDSFLQQYTACVHNNQNVPGF